MMSDKVDLCVSCELLHAYKVKSGEETEQMRKCEALNRWLKPEERILECNRYVHMGLVVTISQFGPTSFGVGRRTPNEEMYSDFESAIEAARIRIKPNE